MAKPQEKPQRTAEENNSAPVPPAEPPAATTRAGETREQLWERLRRQARSEGATRKDSVMYASAAVERLLPKSPETPVQTAEGQVRGLGDIPADWPELPANASLASEISWVQANRLRVVEEKSGVTKVHLYRCLAPPPSHAALGWLETSIRAYAKYCDIAARATAQQQDEQEHVRREKAAIEDMRRLLAEMQPRCPHCGKSLM